MLPIPEARRSPIALKRALVDLDWQEIVTFSFVDSADGSGASPPSPRRSRSACSIPSPASCDVMRTSLLPGLIETLQTNLNRKESRIRHLRTGPHVPPRGGRATRSRCAWAASRTAAPTPEQWGEPARDVDFYDVKGDLEALVAPRGLRPNAAEHPALHPGRCASVAIDGIAAGWLGELHPRLVRHFGLPKRARRLRTRRRRSLSALPMPAGKPVSRLPIVRRDLGLVVDEAVPAQALLDALSAGQAAACGRHPAVRRLPGRRADGR